MQTIQTVKSEFETSIEFQRRAAEIRSNILLNNPYYNFKLRIESSDLIYNADSQSFQFRNDLFANGHYGRLDRDSGRFNYSLDVQEAGFATTYHDLLLDQPRQDAAITASIEQARQVRDYRANIYEIIVTTPVEPYRTFGHSHESRGGRYSRQIFYHANVECRYYVIESRVPGTLRN